MDKHIFIMIRYSVLTKSKDAWVIGKNQAFTDYKNKLFSSSRLQLHERLFRDVTFPSLCEMNPTTTTVMIFISDELPQVNKTALMEVVGNRQNFKVLEVSKSDSVIGKMNSELLKVLRLRDKDVCYATVRLDDDDALADDFEKALIKYVAPEFDQHAISFSKGYNAFYEDNKYLSFQEIKYPLIALGLSYINVFRKEGELPYKTSVYSLGNHTKIDERFPVITKADTPMYLRTIHKESDIYHRKFKEKVAVDDFMFDLGKVKNSFVSIRSNPALYEDVDSNVVVGGDTEKRTESKILTHHQTVLCYSVKENALLHVTSSEIDNNEIFCIRYDEFSSQLYVVGLSAYVNLSDVGEVSLSKEKGSLDLEFKNKGFSISPCGLNLFITPLRNGRVILSPHCRAWEIFYIH